MTQNPVKDAIAALSNPAVGPGGDSPPFIPALFQSIEHSALTANKPTQTCSIESPPWKGELSEDAAGAIIHELRNNVRWVLRTAAFRASTDCLDDSFDGDTLHITFPPRRMSPGEPAIVEPFQTRPDRGGFIYTQNPAYPKCTQEQFIEKPRHPVFDLAARAGVGKRDGNSYLWVVLWLQQDTPLRSGWGQLYRAGRYTQAYPVLQT